jgi:hypothetical protein
VKNTLIFFKSISKKRSKAQALLQNKPASKEKRAGRQALL